MEEQKHKVTRCNPIGNRKVCLDQGEIAKGRVLKLKFAYLT